MITREAYITASGKYTERLKSPDLTPEVEANIESFLRVVNAFLEELGIYSPTVSSGFRPRDVNKRIKSAAKASYHMQGLAVDISDPNGIFDDLFASSPQILRKYGLFLESPPSTPGWAHLDMGQRSDRPSRIFLP